jgi:CBS domain-containing protein
VVSDELGDDPYFERPRELRGFDANLVREPLTQLPVREALVLGSANTVTEAMRAMQRDHTGCVLVTDDGTRSSKLVGIFTERDVLIRIVDRGKNPATLPLSEVMTPDPETLHVNSTVAYALNKMSVGGFRHVPVVDSEHRPAFVVSVRDIVEFLVEAFPREVLNLPIEGRPVTQKAREGA